MDKEEEKKNKIINALFEMYEEVPIFKAMSLINTKKVSLECRDESYRELCVDGTRETQHDIVLKAIEKGFNHPRLISKMTGIELNQCRARCTELEYAGIIEQCEEKMYLKETNRMVTVYRCKDKLF